jgi:hypothetical protein
MITAPEIPGNKQKLARLTAVWQELLAAALKRDFYGKAMVEITVNDGVIQSIRKQVEHIEK